MRGKTLASTTRRFRAPRTRKRLSRTAIGSPSAPIGHEQEAFRGRVEVFILTSISAFIEIVEVDFGHLERVPRAECNCPSAVLGVSFEHKPCHEVVFGSKVRVGSVCRVTLVVTLEEPRQSKDEKIWRRQPGPGFL